MWLSAHPDVGFSAVTVRTRESVPLMCVALLCSCDPPRSNLFRLYMLAPPSRLVFRWLPLRSLLASSGSDSYGGKKGPHYLQDVKSFIGHVLCEYGDGDGHVPDDSCSGSPAEATLLIDGAGLRQPLSLAHPSDGGPHSTLPGPPKLLDLPLLQSLLAQVI